VHPVNIVAPIRGQVACGAKVGFSSIESARQPGRSAVRLSWTKRRFAPQLATLGVSGHMTPTSRKVWEQIAAAFSPILPPQPITTCECEECLDVRANLGHLRWNDVLLPAIEKHFGSLPLLTDDAFQALLPAFLFRALDDISAENKFLEWTLYAVCGAYEEDEATTEAADADRRRRIARFTRQQRESVRAFLALVTVAPNLDIHHAPVAHALAAIWTLGNSAYGIEVSR